MEKKESRIPKPLLPILTAGSIAASIYGILSKAFAFVESLNEQGTGALTDLIKPGILVLISLILSIAYISSSNKSKKMAAEGESSAAKAVRTIIDVIVRTCIGLLIVAIIASGVYGYLMYREYMQRPRINVLDFVNVSEAIDGYNGTGTFSEDKVEYNVPIYVEDLYKEGDNFDNREDYAEEQSEWDDFRSYLKYEVKPSDDPLDNDDTVTISAEYQGKDLFDRQAKMHIVFHGIGEKEARTVKVGDIKELPTRYANQSEVNAAKSDVINAACDKLENDTLTKYNASDYQAGCVFCMPKYNRDTEPDALVIVASYIQDKGESYERKMYRACYIYPFDSRVGTDITGRSGGWESGELQFILDDPTEDLGQLEREIKSGDKFDSNAEYGMEKIER